MKTCAAAELITAVRTVLRGTSYISSLLSRDAVSFLRRREKKLVKEDDRLICTLEIADNGSGADAPEGNGLRGMRERLEAIGGSLQRQSQAGTRLVIHLPLAPAAATLRN